MKIIAVCTNVSGGVSETREIGRHRRGGYLYFRSIRGSSAYYHTLPTPWSKHAFKDLGLLQRVWSSWAFQDLTCPRRRAKFMAGNVA